MHTSSLVQLVTTGLVAAAVATVFPDQFIPAISVRFAGTLLLATAPALSLPSRASSIEARGRARKHKGKHDHDIGATLAEEDSHEDRSAGERLDAVFDEEEEDEETIIARHVRWCLWWMTKGHGKKNGSGSTGGGQVPPFGRNGTHSDVGTGKSNPRPSGPAAPRGGDGGFKPTGSTGGGGPKPPMSTGTGGSSGKGPGTSGSLSGGPLPKTTGTGVSGSPPGSLPTPTRGSGPKPGTPTGGAGSPTSFPLAKPTVTGGSGGSSF